MPNQYVASTPMTNSVLPDQILLTLHPSGGGSEVSVEVLTQSLTALQEMVYLAALQTDGRPFRERLRLSEEVKNRYILQCAPPVIGSFSVSSRVVNRSAAKDLFAPVQAAKVATLVLGFCHAAATGDTAKAVNLFPDSRLRNRMITCVEKLSPPLGSGHRCELAGESITATLRDTGLPEGVKALICSPESQKQMQTVTGRLCEIDFVKHRLTIFHAPTQRALECFYDENIEMMLLENRRDLIQVTGLVIMDGENQPKQIIDVEQIWDLDLSPFVISEADGRNACLRARNRVELIPSLSQDEQLVCIECESWGLDAFAETRTELLLEVKNQLLMLWAEYAKESDDVLSEPARQIKYRLLEDWMEAASA